MSFRHPIIDSTERDAFTPAEKASPASSGGGQPAANVTEPTPANLVDLKRKARAIEFSAAWGDDWNPNPLSDLSS